VGYGRMNDSKIARCKYCNQVYLINESTLYTHTILCKKSYDDMIALKLRRRERNAK
jgi:hypothetical protein